jgi:hypothetical protein
MSLTVSKAVAKTAAIRRLRLLVKPAVMFAAIAMSSGTLQAALLVGTIVTAGTETIAEMNQLIADYNTDFGAALPGVSQLVDKIEGQNAADFVEGNLQLGDFNFYEENSGGGTSLNIFDATVNFAASGLGVAAGFDTLDQNVFAFEQLSGPQFYYYVSKGGNLGWSLWAAGGGLNPVYTDAGTGASSIVGTDFTRGAITDNLLAYDPVRQGVSHISFYSAIPEPGSAALVIAAAGVFCFGCSRRTPVRQR